MRGGNGLAITFAVITAAEAVAPTVGIDGEGITAGAFGTRLVSNECVLIIGGSQGHQLTRCIQRVPQRSLEAGSPLPDEQPVGRSQSGGHVVCQSFEPIGWNVWIYAPQEPVLFSPGSVGGLTVF